MCALHILSSLRLLLISVLAELRPVIANAEDFGLDVNRTGALLGKKPKRGGDGSDGEEREEGVQRHRPRAQLIDDGSGWTTVAKGGKVPCFFSFISLS